MFPNDLPYNINLRCVQQFPELFLKFAKANDCFNTKGALQIKKAARLLNGNGDLTTHCDWLAKVVDSHNIIRQRNPKGSRKLSTVKPIKAINQAESVHVSFVNMKSY